MEFDDDISTYINSLKDMILDEDKLVTYLSLSKDLCIHVNKSKTLLSSFLKNIRNDKPNVKFNVNYLVSGLIDNNTAKVTLCNEDTLDDIRKTFTTIFYSHIYSINKGNPNIDQTAYVNINKYDDFNLCSGIIKNNNNKRSSNEISTLKSSSQDKINTKPNISNVSDTKKLALKNGITHKQVKCEPDIEEAVKKGIPPLLNEDTRTKQNKNTSKGISGFFNKQNGNVKKKISQDKSVENIIPKEEKDVVKRDKDEEKMEVEEDNIFDKNLENKIKKENGYNENKVLNHIKKNSKVDRKRKRLLHVSDTESEEDQDTVLGENSAATVQESDDEIPGTPVANIKITNGIVNAKKKRKIVDKTYMGDDGYIHTKREEIYESCSDTEKESPKKEIKKASPKESPIKAKTSKKKISPPQKGKQQTLMNFFKKK
ncbi:DNA polymerase delta subunit 3-like [Leptidea sinapis]|uniref:DNA polymerase delta subunit 3-like n=1 Tax=Leptidea sinapis TaxID=189913 RepID=UPI0021C46EB0|nr:DNA polymerase delta subunit 3-like [Leptidea sinapis]